MQALKVSHQLAGTQDKPTVQPGPKLERCPHDRAGEDMEVDQDGDQYDVDRGMVTPRQLSYPTLFPLNRACAALPVNLARIAR